MSGRKSKGQLRPAAVARVSERDAAYAESRPAAVALDGPAIRNPKSKFANLGGIKPPLHLLPYQRRWIEDGSPLKIVVKARQIGYSFAATLRAVLECVKRKTTWIFLSKGERQSRLLMEKLQEHIRSCGIVAQACESSFFEGTLLKQLETRFANGSVIYGLPANPDTARGYSGNVTLDEFAFHADAEKIYAALFPTITRGYALEVISTPNGQQGKFYELAKSAGLVNPVLGAGNLGLGQKNSTHGSPVSRLGSSSTQYPAPSSWSAHCCDIYEAVEQGLKIDIALLRSGCDDEASWQQEFCCQFVTTAENFIPPDLLAACLSAEATTSLHDLPSGASAPGLQGGLGAGNSGSGSFPSPSTQRPEPSTEFFLGIDIGRRHDRTVFWMDETRVSGVGCQVPGEFRVQNSEFRIENARQSIPRLVQTMDKAPFADQLAFARQLLSLRGTDGQPLVRRAAIDSTGMGAPLAEALQSEFGPRVEPVVFTVAVKEDLAYRTRRRMEARLSLLPDTREVRRAFSTVKRLVTATGHLRFDAARSDGGHADEFWAKALADYAAESQPVARLADGFLAEGAPIITPGAFLETDHAFSVSEL